MIKLVDSLFNHMLRYNGERILYDPSLPVAHSHRTQLSAYLKHQWAVGRGNVQVRRRLPSIEGAWLAHYPYLGIMLLPGVTLVKFLRGITRFMAWSPRRVCQDPLILPLFALGLGWWSIGFAHELLLGERYRGVWCGNRSLCLREPLSSRR